MTDQSVSKSRKKELILKKAVSLFSEKGYFKVKVDEVAKAANVAKGTVYLYFKNKDELFINVVVEMVNSFEKSLIQIINTTNTPADFLSQLLKFYMSFVSSIGMDRRMLNERRRDLPLRTKRLIRRVLPEKLEEIRVAVGKKLKSFFPDSDYNERDLGQIVISSGIVSGFFESKTYIETLKRFIINALKKEEK